MPMNKIIQETRKSLGFTQEQIADYLGVSTPAVNKWEKGVTCPDISLLAPLARLLKIDLNTLLCFREELTREEIYQFSNEIAKKAGAEGMEAGFVKAREVLQEYPNCDFLLHTLTLVLEGSLMMSEMTPEEKKPYSNELTAWYERAAKSEEDEVRNGALYMLAGRYLQQNESGRAREALERLPERSALDKRVLLAEVYMQEGQQEEAAKLMERVLLAAINEVHSALMKLAGLELKAGEREIAHRIAEISQKAAELFGLWEYNSLIARMDLAVAEKQTEESLVLLRQMLEAVFQPWDMQASPLYYRIASPSPAEGWTKFLGPLLVSLETDPSFDFLRRERRFQSLLADYRARCEQAGAAMELKAE